ncbi:MAG: NDP-sugar synthase [Endomicrobium sp.]|jgi:mannose-1-phosphate guanylyltransferase/phosphomannomutase|nr:NDP-sugar synthase [Endomicrobium sp.]
MKAFVLAAGAGTRLRPLTSDIPKPMVPVLGRPAIYHTLMNLKKNGFCDICVNLFYKPEVITEYFKDENIGVNLTFSPEKKLLGTAGAVKKNESFFDDTFCVMSGDGLSDADLRKILNFHKKNKALATIALKNIDERFEYGVTVTDKNGKVKSFIEKPYLKDVFESAVNTGMYFFEPEIFDYIPKNKFFDFGKDLFPLLLKNNKRVFGCVFDGYWTDIGNIYEYKKGVFDALSGKLKLYKSLGKYVSASAKIDKTAKILAPCFIDDGVKIGKNAVIKPYSVLSKNVSVKDNAEISKSIIWEDAVVGKNAKADNTVVGYKAQIPDDIILFDSILITETANKRVKRK